MNVSLYIAKRYLRSKSSNNAINIISSIAAFGIIIGAMALFIVLSGFSGLKELTVASISVADPDLKISSAKGKRFELSAKERSELNTITQVASYSQIIEERFVLKYGEKIKIVTVKGVDENYPKQTIAHILQEGRWMAPNTDQIVSGSGVAYNLGLSFFSFDKALKILAVKPGKGQISSQKSAYTELNVTNVGSFSIDEDLNNSSIYANLETVQYLLNYTDNQITALELRLTDLEAIDTVKESLQNIFGDKVVIKNRIQLNDALYKMLNTENLAVYLIFTLVLIIALFNIVGAIVMMILDKKSNLKTLFNLGLTLKNIRRIFFFQGVLMTLVGGAIGLLLGYISVLLQSKLSLLMLTESIAYPVSILPINFIIVFLTISFLGILASKIASTRITKRLID